MIEIDRLQRFAAAGAAAQAGVDALGAGVADDRARKMSASDDRLALAATGLLAAVDGLSTVPALPNEPAARLLADPADRLRAELRRVGAIG